MKLIQFDNQTHIINKDKENEIPFHLDPVSKFVTVCVEVTEDDMQEIKDNGRKLFVTLFAVEGMPFPLIAIEPKPAFRQLTEEEKKKVETNNKKLHVLKNRQKRNKKTSNAKIIPMK